MAAPALRGGTRLVAELGPPAPHELLELRPHAVVHRGLLVAREPTISIELLRAAGISRLAGEYCYDVFAREQVRDVLSEEPGTYFLTDFLARTFERTVVRELGLDRYP